jgi:hypothetical protein
MSHGKEGAAKVFFRLRLRDGERDGRPRLFPAAPENISATAAAFSKSKTNPVAFPARLGSSAARDIGRWRPALGARLARKPCSPQRQALLFCIAPPAHVRENWGGLCQKDFFRRRESLM